MTSTARQPVLFIPHGGGPCFFMPWDPPHTWDALKAFLASIPDRLPAKPSAILIISAHWETEATVEVTANANPPLIYDYTGFPALTYTLTYPVQGDQTLAESIANALDAAGIPAIPNPTRGLDHGVFIPLKVAFPKADIPVIQVSLLTTHNPAEHRAIGQALAPFRDENVLIIGSGMSYHNMPGLFGAAGATEDSEAFTAWLKTTVEAEETTRNAQLEAWEAAPAARESHPDEEHLLPLMVAAGAAGEDRGHTVFSGLAMGVRLTAFAFGAFKP